MEKLASVVYAKRIPRAKSHRERVAWQQHELICGVDEVGRGCLAGPLVTAAVILHPNCQFSLLKDSKVLTAPERIRAAKWVRTHSWHAYGVVSHQEIDQFNIYQATLHAMRRAVIHAIQHAPKLPSGIIVDAMPVAFAHGALADIPVDFFPCAEQESISVAAASIIAKVKRDELMRIYDNIIPGYALYHHKGYATKLHREHVAVLGASIIHRKSFLKNMARWGKEHEHTEQQVSLLCRSA